MKLISVSPTFDQESYVARRASKEPSDEWEKKVSHLIAFHQSNRAIAWAWDEITRLCLHSQVIRVVKELISILVWIYFGLKHPFHEVFLWECVQTSSHDCYSSYPRLLLLTKSYTKHIFTKAQATSNKNAHNFWHHFQAQFLMLFHLVWSILFRVLAWETTFSLVEIL